MYVALKNHVEYHANLCKNAFMVCCMLPLLQLLDTYRQSPAPTEEMTEVIRSLEGLLIDHVVLPLRDSFLNLAPAIEIEDEVSSASFSDRMVSLLRSCFPHLASPVLRADWKTDKHLALSTISLLYDIAIRSRPRNTPELRRLENPWLEQLFVKLTKCAETLFPPVSSFKAQKDHIRLIKWMLRKAVDHQVQLSISSIEVLLDKASGLFHGICDGKIESGVDLEDDNPIEWGLVRLCILNDSDAFVIPSYAAPDTDTYAYRPPNKYLSALLQSLTDQVCYESLEEDQDYDFKLVQVIQPLCKAFTDARDLTGFLEHWREQLNMVQKRQRCQENSFDLVKSIWEDERLPLYVAQLVESSLTVGQISRILSTATDDLALCIPNGLNDKSLPLASLIMLDCVYIGLSRDETFVKLESMTLSVFSLLGRLIPRSSQLTSPDDWRVWRIAAVITDRWLSLRDSSAFKCKAHPMICTASGLINHISSELTLHDNVDLTEELHAVKFMLKFAAMEDSFWEDLRFSSRQKILSAMSKVLDIMEPFCLRMSHDHFGTMMHNEEISDREQPLLRISPVDSFYFDCINEVVGSPDILG